ncbi:hypothetical protein [Neptunomonas qingdaonensis]|uniref:Uncharacterized protein n=1 Tax=Neptunomonas qingdaonensis TaxID=1045558 RepID=A0A1I2S9I5_9GAMM|nr:hypothetical protein [Neptunomonas qingdaonensis]SFG48993.1 hypothetical protein SAMN05216175_107156 [Neptunomonas qingdaonensis]
MSMFGKCKLLLIGMLAQGMLNTAVAGEVSILMADFRNVGSNQWAVNVTLKHSDEGWDHYADNWRVVDAQGNVLGERVLFHPHVDEQPFTRGINSVQIPAGVTNVYIEAHDKEHGWSAQRLQVDLAKVKSGHVRVNASGVGE